MEPNQVQEKSNGALIGSIVIIIILIIGGIYLWKSALREKPMPVDSNLSEESSNSSTAEMEASLNSMNFDNLDEGI